MVQSKKKLNCSGLCTDVLQLVFERLTSTELNRAKLVCSSWHSASRGCVPKRNQIPWLILFPGSNENKKCVLYVPDDRDKFYETRDLGVDFVQSTCLAIYGSWLLMMDTDWNVNILNPLTGERIDLPLTESVIRDKSRRPRLKSSIACLWVDEETKEYLVVWKMLWFLAFTKKGDNKWRPIFSNPVGEMSLYKQMTYNHKARKLYAYTHGKAVQTWCFSCEDDPPQVAIEDKYSSALGYNPTDFLPDIDLFIRESERRLLWRKALELYWKEYVDSWVNIAITVSGEVIKVASVVQRSKRWLFRIYKASANKIIGWEKMDSLGDEALILDMGITVVAKDIPAIKKNSIYFSGVGYGRKNPDHIFVYDLTTHEIENLPNSILSPIHLADARWFFPR